MNIIYRDRNLIVVEKPPGMASQQERGLDMDAVSWIRIHLHTDYVGVVHRLDKPVGGVMVYALDPQSAARLSEQVRARQVSKTYEAAVYGQPAQSGGTLEDMLLEDRRSNVTKVAAAGTPKARRAVLSYETEAVLRREEQCWTLLRIHLLTGRRHQIRVQLAHAGYGIAGDRKYSPEAPLLPGYRGLALYASELEFAHPVSGERMKFSARPEFADIFRRDGSPAET